MCGCGKQKIGAKATPLATIQKTIQKTNLTKQDTVDAISTLLIVILVVVSMLFIFIAYEWIRALRQSNYSWSRLVFSSW